MRVLLHDTQMNLEKFSGHVEALISNVKETSQELRKTSSTFEQEHDKLLGDIIDLVNRSQKQLQSSIGSPAQSAALDAFMNKVELRLESLDQRLDAMQAFNQTHSQALQTQIREIQNLQAQQNLILNAVTPLLPLLQSLPPRLAPSMSLVNPSQTQRTDASSQTIIEKHQPSYHPETLRKRQRVDSDIQEISPPKPLPGSAQKKRRIESPRSVQKPSLELTQRLFPSSSPDLIKYSTDSEGPSTKPQVNERSAPLVTPRRPLQDLFPFPPGSNQRSVSKRPMPPSSTRLVGPGKSATPGPSRVGAEESRAALARRPLIKPLAIAPLASSSTSKTPVHISNFTPKPVTPSLRNAVAGEGRALKIAQTPQALKNERMTSQTAKNTTIPPPAGMVSLSRSSTITTATATKPLNTPRFGPEANKPLLLRAPTNNGPRPLQERMKEPVREGRRFIPLVDTDDEDDSD
uniref:Basidiospore development protein n=1 Tax=Coprinopsis cinerea TaxID=5346 RepID=Q7Z8Q2_COPCI|nr:basidiospore development protein [Coprinopsis cinerea]